MRSRNSCTTSKSASGDRFCFAGGGGAGGRGGGGAGGAGGRGGGGAGGRGGGGRGGGGGGGGAGGRGGGGAGGGGAGGRGGAFDGRRFLRAAMVRSTIPAHKKTAHGRLVIQAGFFAMYFPSFNAPLSMATCSSTSSSPMRCSTIQRGRESLIDLTRGRPRPQRRFQPQPLRRPALPGRLPIRTAPLHALPQCVQFRGRLRTVHPARQSREIQRKKIRGHS